MFGLGIWELLMVVVVGLLVLGPRKLPQVARQIGRAMREFRRASNELRRGLDDVIEPTDPKAGYPYDDGLSKSSDLTELRDKPTEIAGTVPKGDDASTDSADEQPKADASTVKAVTPPSDDAETK